MFLSSAIIILREVLEAALLLGIFFALAQTLCIRQRWASAAILIGMLTTVGYAFSIGVISEYFEGAGQEIFNAALQFLIIILLFVINALLPTQKGRERIIPLCMIITIVFSITREGSEIVIYFSSFLHQAEHRKMILLGGLLGAGIGFSVGALFYYLLVSFPRNRLIVVADVLLAFVAAGLVSQAINLLIQVDWLTAKPAIINTEQWLPEASIVGQMLYALIGYESTPGPQQLVAYLLVLFLMLAVSFFAFRTEKGNSSGKSLPMTE